MAVEVVNGGGGTDTSDATLDSNSKLVKGITAYANGTKYTGSLSPNSQSHTYETVTFYSNTGSEVFTGVFFAQRFEIGQGVFCIGPYQSSISVQPNIPSSFDVFCPEQFGSKCGLITVVKEHDPERQDEFNTISTTNMELLNQRSISTGTITSTIYVYRISGHNPTMTFNL